MSKTNNNDKNHADAKQPKDRILRAKDIIPGATKSNPEKKPLSAKNISADNTDSTRNTSDIPKFDLAEEILAEQRKITALRRTAPTQKVETPNNYQQIKPTGFTIEQPQAQLSQQQQIVADIVARDIEKLCSANITYLY